MQERRRFQRVAVEGLSGRVFFSSEAKVLNLSLGGCAIEVDRSLKPRQPYTIKLRGKDGREIALRGTVVWCELRGSPPGVHRGDVVPTYRAGLSFQDVLTDEKTSQLLQFIQAHSSGAAERLRGLRVRVRTERAALDYPHRYKVKRLSLSGMLIETTEPLRPEGHYPMELHLPQKGSIRFSGRVAHCNAHSGGLFHVGVEFQELSQEHAAMLEEFLRELQPIKKS